MKKFILNTTLSVIPFAAASAIAEEIKISDFTEATSAYEDAYFNGQMNANSGNQDQTSYDVNLSADYERVFASPTRNTKIDFLGDTSRSKGPNDGDKSESTYQALGSVTSDQYFKGKENKQFWYGKGEIGARKDMEDPYTKATVGVGYGKVVNATPMAKSIRLIEALLERGLLQSQPSKEVYLRVANVIDRESEFRSKFGAADYELEWLTAIEEELGSELSVKGAIKAYDVLTTERISTRKYGWLVRAGAGQVFSDYDGGDSKPAIEVGAEYHKPISNRTQFSNEAIFTTTFDDDNDSYNLNNAMTLTHEVSDRVDWENTWLLDFSSYDAAEDVLINTASSTYRYYLNNAISLSLTAKLVDLDDGVDNNGNDELEKTVLAGLTYRLK